MPEKIELTQRRPWWHRWSWSQKSDYSRLERELKSFRVELDLLVTRCETLGNTWSNAARCEIQNVEAYLDLEQNIEGGWMSLHAARRHAVHGFSLGELAVQASILLAEATKIHSWRGKEMNNLLSPKDEPLTVHRIIAAMALRDEYFSNQYHKIWLVGSQITILLTCCGLGLLLLVPLVVSSSYQVPRTVAPWGYQMVTAVIFFGLLGAAFSAAGSLMNTDTTSKVPERVANQFVTIARALFGSGVGLEGYALYQSKIMNFHFGDDAGPGSALAIAFLFGFTGEVLIARVLGTLGSSHPEKDK